MPHLLNVTKILEENSHMLYFKILKKIYGSLVFDLNQT